MLKEDLDILERCHQQHLNKEYFSEVLHLFTKNTDIDAHNEKMIDLICADIHTLFEIDRKRKKKSKTNRYDKLLFNRLPVVKTARHMLTKNRYIHDNLANIVTGPIFDFIQNND
ncbi:unnamed protein product [Rotaria socialis]|uniref:Uncharacterized protein n=1 Tax=Rotaria socialis TaxID=392032 RepID=A0A819Y3S1_9BILA|nr:unnamed protein product [Rotaria socialis]CAF3298317.1 unnamed protein product [Rotaria socialis]CAF3318169.1 unnamed protein product [Rotaria socialis]CAF4150310.1 unnamed protein product [Rotaria socialis]CAF4372415.1 unnamed protein product [Rotaria socialis]